MGKIKKNFKVLSLVTAIILIIVFMVYFITQNPSFELKNEQLINNYDIYEGNDNHKGKIYEQDVVFSGKMSQDVANKYTENIEVPEEADILIVNFYNKYIDDIEMQPEYNLKYKIEKHKKIT